MRYSVLVAIPAALSVAPSALAVGEPIAWWTFDQISSNAAIDEVGGVNGTLAGPAAMVAGGVSGGALDVRNGGWADMGLNFDLIGTAFSMQTWIRTSDSSSSSTIIAGKHVTGTFNGYMMRANADTGGYGVSTRASFYQSNSPGSTAVGTSGVTDDEWHHLVATYSSGGLLNLYVDGQLEASIGTTTILANGAPFVVGGVFVSGAGAVGNSFNGLIDEVQLYSYALTGDQVVQLFENPGTAIPAPGALLVAVSFVAVAGRRRR